VNECKPLASGAANAVADPVDFAVTSADLDTTLVVYMGLGTLPALAKKLIASGFPAGMPAVAVERGTTPAERRVFSTIGRVPATRSDPLYFKTLGVSVCESRIPRLAGRADRPVSGPYTLTELFSPENSTT